MARALSDDLRKRVLEAGAAGASARSIAARFGVGISTAIRWLRRERESGERTPRR
ncbi:helix-turn-helix domain-containing protein, partial [Acetobacter sp. P1H12_c]